MDDLARARALFAYRQRRRAKSWKSEGRTRRGLMAEASVAVMSALLVWLMGDQSKIDRWTDLILPLVAAVLAILIWEIVLRPFRNYVWQVPEDEHLDARYELEQAQLRHNLQVSHIASLNERVDALNKQFDDTTPKLTARIDSIIAGQTTEIETPTMVAFVVTVTNTGAPSIAEGWRVWLTLPTGPRINVEIIHPNKPLELQMLNGDVVTFDHAIYEKTVEPVQRGGLARGYIMCVSRDVPYPLPLGTKIEVECRDITGKHVIALSERKSTTTQGDEAMYWPGMDQRIAKR